MHVHRHPANVATPFHPVTYFADTGHNPAAPKRSRYTPPASKTLALLHTPSHPHTHCDQPPEPQEAGMDSAALAVAPVERLHLAVRDLQEHASTGVGPSMPALSHCLILSQIHTLSRVRQLPGVAAHLRLLPGVPTTT